MKEATIVIVERILENFKLLAEENVKLKAFEKDMTKRVQNYLKLRRKLEKKYPNLDELRKFVTRTRVEKVVERVEMTEERNSGSSMSRCTGSQKPFESLTIESSTRSGKTRDSGNASICLGIEVKADEKSMSSEGKQERTSKRVTRSSLKAEVNTAVTPSAQNENPLKRKFSRGKTDFQSSIPKKKGKITLPKGTPQTPVGTVGLAPNKKNLASKIILVTPENQKTLKTPFFSGYRGKFAAESRFKMKRNEMNQEKDSLKRTKEKGTPQVLPLRKTPTVKNLGEAQGKKIFSPAFQAKTETLKRAGETLGTGKSVQAKQKNDETRVIAKKSKPAEPLLIGSDDESPLTLSPSPTQPKKKLIPSWARHDNDEYNLSCAAQGRNRLTVVKAKAFFQRPPPTIDSRFVFAVARQRPRTSSAIWNETQALPDV